MDPKRKAEILRLLFPEGMPPEALSFLPEIEEHLRAIMALSSSSTGKFKPIRDVALQEMLARRRGQHHHRSLDFHKLVTTLGSGWHTVTDLAKRYNVTEQAIRYALADLKERGIVLQTREGDTGGPGRKPTQYHTDSKP
jgi:DNA-binding transcriptional ArsR family regulator